MSKIINAKSRFVLRRDPVRLRQQLDEAENYAQWLELAHCHDMAYGLDQWQQEESSDLYDHVTIRSRLERLRKAPAERDNHGLLFALNEGIHGNMAGMGNPRLYGVAKAGTKQLIIDYVDEIVAALNYLASGQASDISTAEKIDFFERASHCYGRTALMMSGAGTLLYFHLGVIKALWENDALPQVISGSSGGAFVTGLLGTHTDAEIEKLFSPAHLLEEIHLEVNLWHRITALRPRQIELAEVVKSVERLLPDLTFEEAFKLTGRHINISVAASEAHQTSRLLNAITSPNVMIREAVLASCAVPGFYPPVALAAKNAAGERQAYLPDRKWVDGSVSDDLPSKRLSRLFGVNHYIVSQINPLASPFIFDTHKYRPLVSTLLNSGQKVSKEVICSAASLFADLVSPQSKLGNLTRIVTSVIRQEYTGDINIFPPSRFSNPFRLLSQRSEAEIMQLVRAGEQSTWPKIEMIRTQTRVSRTLDRILPRLQAQGQAEA